jgi:hypothetical protein
MLFRAQDKFFIEVLKFYRNCARVEGLSDIAQKMTEHIARTEAWQRNHRTKTPDL